MDNIGKLLVDIPKWQREVMGNQCTICYGHNVLTKCGACGWWGRVAPNMEG